MIAHEIHAFGQRIGLDGLSLSSDGRARLDIADIGSFYLELTEKNGHRYLSMYLSAPLADHDDVALRRLFHECSYRRGHPLPLSAGVFSGRAILLTRMEEKSVTASSIENALRFLVETLHQ